MVSAREDIFSRSLRTFLKPVLAFWDDPEVMEVLIHGAEDVWVDRGGALERVDITFPLDDLTQSIRKIAQLVGVLVNEENPHLTKRLSDGTELSIVLPPLSRTGPVLALRKGRTTQPTLKDLCDARFLTPAVASLLRAALVRQQSMLLVGATGSGVDQLLQALVREIPASERLVRIERESTLPFEHPHLLSFALSSTEDSRTTLRDLVPTMMMLRPHRVIAENMNADDASAMMQCLAGGYPGSVATLRAYHVQHALQILEMHGLRHSPDASLKAIRAQVLGAFSLIVSCRRQPNGQACLEEVSELLPLSQQGTHRLLPLFRRRMLDLSGSIDSAEPSEVLLPLGHIPSFWSRIRHWQGGILDRAFFHPANYDSDGIRVESKAIPATAPVGVPVEEGEERESRPRTMLERELPPPRSRPTQAPPVEEPVGEASTSTAMAASSAKQPATAEPNQDEDEERTFLQSPSKVVKTPKTSAELKEERRVQTISAGDEIVTEPGRSLLGLQEEEAASAQSIQISEQDVEASVSLAEIRNPDADLERASTKMVDAPPHGMAEKLPTKITPQPPAPQPGQSPVQPSSDVMSLNPDALGVGPTISGPSLAPVPQQVVLGQKPGLMDSIEFSTALTVSRVAPPKVEGISTSPHVIVAPELMAADQEAMEVAPSQVLDVSDIVADDLPSILSDEDLRRAEQELRQPVQRREPSTQMLPHPHLATEVVSRERAESPRQWSVPEQSYVDPEDTFRQGLSPLLGGVKPAAKTEPDTPSIEDDASLPHISPGELDQSRPSVVVRRGSRQPVAPAMNNIDSDATNIRGRAPGVPMSRPPSSVYDVDQQMLRASYAGMPAQGSSASHTGLPAQGSSASHTGLPAQDAHASHANLPAQNPPPSPPTQGPPPLPAARASGIRPPATPPPPIPSVHSPTSDNANEATLIRGRRPPQFKK